MMYEETEGLSEESFKRLLGVRRGTFLEMLGVLEAHEAEKPERRRGQPYCLGMSDQLMITLTYWREYRTQFAIAQDWCLAESTICNTIRRVEDILIKDARFHLPGKKAFEDEENPVVQIAMDVTEIRIERPKKNSASITAARRRITQ